MVRGLVRWSRTLGEHRMYHFFDLFGIGGGGVLDELVVVGGVIQLMVQPTFSVYIGPDIHWHPLVLRATKDAEFQGEKLGPIMLTTDEFQSHSTGQQYQLEAATSCKSVNVIYMIQCKRCGQQYVGESGQALHGIQNSHQADIVHKRIDGKPVATHFNAGHLIEDMSVMVIELWKDDPVLRKIRENRWISTLDAANLSRMSRSTDNLWPIIIIIIIIIIITCIVILHLPIYHLFVLTMCHPLNSSQFHQLECVYIVPISYCNHIWWRPPSRNVVYPLLWIISF